MKLAALTSTMLSVFVLSGLAACSQLNHRSGDLALASDVQRTANNRSDHVVSTIRFQPGQENLNENAKTELQRSISEARSLGDIEDVTVAVWSDMEYPRNENARLPRGQVKLAEKRGDRIETYLARDLDLSTYRVHVHNMGEKPAFLSSYFETADSELKQQLSAMGIAPSGEQQVVNGRASSALVFIKTK